MSVRESRNILIVTLIVAVLAVVGSIAYSNIDFKGTGKSGQTKTNWKVDITDISICTLNDENENSKCQAIKGDAFNVSKGIDKDSTLRANFTANVTNYGDAITYKVVVKNSGALNAKLSSVRFKNDNNGPVIFTYNNLEDEEVLKSGASKTFYVMVSYIEDKEISNNEISNTLELNFLVAD